MAVPQILALPTPLKRRPLPRRLKNTGKKFKRLLKSRVRATKRFASQITRKHYFLTAAYRDIGRAVAHNEDVVIAAFASTTILVYACAVIAVQFMVAFSRVTYAVGEKTTIDMALFIMGLTPVVLTILSLLAALCVNFMSLSLMDGANRKVYRSIRSTFRGSLKTASRTACAWYLLAIVHFFRLLLLLIPLYIYIKVFSNIAVLSMPALTAAATATGVWLLAGAIRYSLVPYVALFEPQCLLVQTFKRSRELTKKQAPTFLITGSLLLSVYFAGVLKLGAGLRDHLGVTTNLFFAISILAAIMAANAGLVMLYRKRKLARS